MTLQEFKTMATKEHVSTCNGWGFGGYYGKTFTMDKLQFRDTKWGYRHMNSTPYRAYFVNSISVPKATFLTTLEPLEFIAPKPKLTKPKFVSKNPKVKQTELPLN